MESEIKKSTFYTYWRCRRCGKLLCYPIEVEEEEEILCLLRDSNTLIVDQYDHPGCTMLYPEKFITACDFVFFTSEKPDKKLAEELGYDIDFNLLDKASEPVTI